MELGLVTLAELLELELWKQAAARVRERIADLDGDELRRAILHELIDWQVCDLLEQTSARLGSGDIHTADDVQAAELLVTPTGELGAGGGGGEKFLFRQVYRHRWAEGLWQRAEQMLTALFDYFVEHPEAMPAGFQQRAAEHGLQRTVGQYIAGMTDRYAHELHQRFCT